MSTENIKKYSVYQHWDPLNVCIVGQTYPPEYYQWITIPHVRKLFEKIAIETEQDYQSLISKLHEFGVKTVRPDLPNFEDIYINGNYMPPGGIHCVTTDLDRTGARQDFFSTKL